MTKIDRYIGNSVLWAFLIVAVVLLGLDFALTFIEQIKKVNDHYTLQSLLQVILYRLPGKLAEYIPIASLIGTLMGLGTLAATSELTVMRAAGMPIWRIGFAACQPILLVSLLGMGISEYIAPAAAQKANLIEKFKNQESGTFSLTGGVWLKADNNFVYIDAVDGNGKLYNIQIFSPEGQTLQNIKTASSAEHIEGTQWQLNNVTETLFAADHVEKKTMAKANWDVSITPEHLFLAAQDPDTLSLSQLKNYQHYLREQKLDSSQYELEFWITALRPIASLALVLVALSSVFGPLRSSTMGSRIFSGVIIGLAFQNALNLFGRMSVAISFPPVIGVSIPIIICLLAGIVLIRRRG
ncbi:MAG: LPS export ABC transporter permease LptG [Marinomonas sp.]|jgi:lipopolysaccharide export system permease protein|uniref:LPS export ABC transporter permease LptG n=1 Tax=Marinomonas pontica TaxID=264739 RepID=A0ABM8FGA0_9GAMM|nr:LPS export ABC transporter permease LptG [Marinomonas pontica]MCW8357620.1 LPS export ABC transporter permease LptG [Marinomonas pontica]BDX04105.1 LPS export ABC transporter permease LptG [Marinomonas pontica]